MVEGGQEEKMSRWRFFQRQLWNPTEGYSADMLIIMEESVMVKPEWV